MTDDIDRAPITPRLAEGIETLRLGARSVIDEALARLPDVHRRQIQHALASGQCCLSVQISPGGVHVLADGAGWARPQCLFAIERLEEPENDTPIAP